jgi:hypothetical protein
MKISNSKKQLAKIIHENGGWRDGAESAAQCINGEVSFWHDTATKQPGGDWCGNYLGAFDDIEFTGVKLPNRHRTILSRDEYIHLYPAPDADGWIEWNGGECPVDHGALLDVKFEDDMVMLGAPAGLTGGDFERNLIDWSDDVDDGSRIVAYRLHKPEQAKPKYCEAVMRSIPEPSDKPTIEQLAADYRNAKDYADRKQQEADAAKADAEAKLAELVAAGKVLGLVLSVAPVQKYTGKFYNAELGEAPAYGKDTRDAVCDGCGKRYGAHYGNHCKSGSEE